MKDMTPQTSQGAITLTSERLSVQIASPGSAYRGTRFDWTGFITQVTLDGRHTFCMPESLQAGKGSGGMGLCNEFGNEMPIGFDDAKPGDTFPKLGIGLLVRPDGNDYSYLRTYEIAQAFPVQVQATPDCATFVSDALDCRGYAARLEKRVSVRDCHLQIDYQFDNVGRRPIISHEYTHNFIGIDRQPLGPDYRLRFPCEIELEDAGAVAEAYIKLLPMPVRKVVPRSILRGGIATLLRWTLRNVIVDGREWHFRAMQRGMLYGRLLHYGRSEQAQWEITHVPSGVGVREYDDFAPTRVAVWSADHVISAEAFAGIRVQPGESQRWSRRYEFFEESKVG